MIRVLDDIFCSLQSLDMPTTCDNDLVFSTDWFSRNIPHWELHLKHLNGKSNLHALEIGSWEGRSACWLLTNILTHPTSRLTCIDPFVSGGTFTNIVEKFVPLPPDLDIEERFDSNIRAIRAEAKVIKIKGLSEDLLRRLPGDHFDTIYIDGSHVAADVLTDGILAWKTLKIGGLLIFDDYELNLYNDPLRCPRIAIDAFLNVFEKQYELLERGSQIILRKLPRPASIGP